MTYLETEDYLNQRDRQSSKDRMQQHGWNGRTDSPASMPEGVLPDMSSAMVSCWTSLAADSFQDTKVDSRRAAAVVTKEEGSGWAAVVVVVSD